MCVCVLCLCNIHRSQKEALFWSQLYWWLWTISIQDASLPSGQTQHCTLCALLSFCSPPGNHRAIFLLLWLSLFWAFYRDRSIQYMANDFAFIVQYGSLWYAKASLLLIKIVLNVFVCACLCVCMRAYMCACVHVHMCRSEDNLQVLVLSFHHAGPGGETQVIRVGSQCLCPRSHLRGLISYYNWVIFHCKGRLCPVFILSFA